jgi:hypothetical protein
MCLYNATLLLAYGLGGRRLTLRIGGGAALLAVGAAMLVFANPNHEEVALSLR